MAALASAAAVAVALTAARHPAVRRLGARAAERAQAAGDLQTLQDLGRRAARVALDELVQVGR